ncbi:MAG: c-type cytochrome [Phaeodactylibacter sp.]|nr:c-type cytochrome [Phaeodactylibacter sp.]
MMKQTLISLSLIALAVACGHSTVENSAHLPPEPDGEKVYKTYCITCHGLYGNMGGGGAFNLQVSKLSVEERVLVITNGRNAMTPFKTLLSPKEIEAVAAYTLKLKPDKPEGE